MAEMSFREPNQVLWRGFRPGHNGTQVVASKSKSNGYDDLYQPGAGEVACINTITLGADGVGSGVVAIILTDSTNTIIAWIIRSKYISGEHFDSVCITFPEPLEMINQQKLRVWSSALNAFVNGFCKGRVE